MTGGGGAERVHERLGTLEPSPVCTPPWGWTGIWATGSAAGWVVGCVVGATVDCVVGGTLDCVVGGTVDCVVGGTVVGGTVVGGTVVGVVSRAAVCVVGSPNRLSQA
jgi:hypothetical protein